MLQETSSPEEIKETSAIDKITTDKDKIGVVKDVIETEIVTEKKIEIIKSRNTEYYLLGCLTLDHCSTVYTLL